MLKRKPSLKKLWIFSCYPILSYGRISRMVFANVRHFLDFLVEKGPCPLPTPPATVLLDGPGNHGGFYLFSEFCALKSRCGLSWHSGEDIRYFPKLNPLWNMIFNQCRLRVERKQRNKSGHQVYLVIFRGGVNSLCTPGGLTDYWTEILLLSSVWLTRMFLVIASWKHVNQTKSNNRTSIHWVIACEGSLHWSQADGTPITNFIFLGLFQYLTMIVILQIVIYIP